MGSRRRGGPDPHPWLHQQGGCWHGGRWTQGDGTEVGTEGEDGEGDSSLGCGHSPARTGVGRAWGRLCGPDRALCWGGAMSRGHFWGHFWGRWRLRTLGRGSPWGAGGARVSPRRAWKSRPFPRRRVHPRPGKSLRTRAATPASPHPGPAALRSLPLSPRSRPRAHPAGPRARHRRDPRTRTRPGPRPDERARAARPGSGRRRRGVGVGPGRGRRRTHPRAA